MREIIFDYFGDTLTFGVSDRELRVDIDVKYESGSASYLKAEDVLKLKEFLNENFK